MGLETPSRLQTCSVSRMHKQTESGQAVVQVASFKARLERPTNAARSYRNKAKPPAYCVCQPRTNLASPAEIEVWFLLP